MTGERIAIVGVGQTVHKSKRTDVNTAELCAEAVEAALADAQPRRSAPSGAAGGRPACTRQRGGSRTTVSGAGRGGAARCAVGAGGRLPLRHPSVSAVVVRLVHGVQLVSRSVR